MIMPLQKPFTDYRLPLPSMHNWFSPYMAGKKRKDIQHLLIRLTKENSSNADQVLKLLPSGDVKVALSCKQTLIPTGVAQEFSDSQASHFPDSFESTVVVDVKTSISESSTVETVPSSDGLDEASSLSSSQQTLPGEANGQAVNTAQYNSGNEMTEDEETPSLMDTS